jgi:hypothetical protein
VEAIALETVAAEQTALTEARGQVVFRRKDDAVVGILERFERAEGLHGPCNRYHFQAGFYIDAPVDLHTKLQTVPPGTRVRMVFRGTQTTTKGYVKKLFSVFVPTQLPMVTPNAT